MIKALEESDDYKIFKSTRNTNKALDRKMTRNNNQTLNTLSQTIYSHNDTIFSTTFKIVPFELKQKVDNLDIEFEELNNLYTKIINKKQFYHNIMMKYNLKVYI